MLPPLYPILDAGGLPRDSAARRARLESLAAELLGAGVGILQYRNKLDAEAEVVADALILRAAVRDGGCLLILNDYPGLVAQTGFDGAHVGQQDVAAEEARKILGAEKMLGVSTHNPEQLAAAELTSADYLAVGPVFATRSKENPDPVIGIEGVRQARALTMKPLVAIGGITLENCKAVLEAGADSVAIISSIFSDAFGKTPGKIASDFLAKLR